MTAATAAPAPRSMGPLGRFRALFVRSESAVGYALLSPTLAVMVLGLALPIALLFAMSLWTQDYVHFDKTPTLANYWLFFEREVFQSLLWKSLGISLTVTIGSALFAYPAAYFIAFRVKKHKLVWLILITVPFWTSYLLRVFAWKIVLGYNGVINSTLIALGIIEQPLDFLLHNVNAVVITLIHAWAAFAILPIYVSLEKIDRGLLEAARDLGEGPVMTFLRVTLPLSMSGVIAAMLFVFIPTVGDYVTPRLVGGTEGTMIGNVIQSMFGRSQNWPLGAALAVISMVATAIAVCSFLFATRWLRRRVA